MTPHTLTLDPEVAEDLAGRTGLIETRFVSRRDALRKSALLGTALAASPLALAALSRRAYGQAPPDDIANILRFALTLEHLEYEFYEAGVAAAGLIPETEVEMFTAIRDHEEEHVLFLQVALDIAPGGDTPPPATGPGAPGRPLGGFDFTGGGLVPDVFTNYQSFLALSQGFEDTGVRAYKGGAPGLIASDEILTNALQIHSVEARHASAVRRVRASMGVDIKGWITGDGPQGLPAAFAPIYAGEGAQVSVAGYNADQISEAFDEPLTMDAVLTIVDPFINPDPPTP